MAKILLVEDDNNLREIYEARLQAEGYTIVSAHDGEEALVVAKAEKPDLIVSDVMMPKISGFEMLDILRNTDSLKTVKVIMLTALGQSDDQQRADKLGADRYLVKSQVTLEDIVNAANELLQSGDKPAATPSNASATPSSTTTTADSSTPTAATTTSTEPATTDSSPPAAVPISEPTTSTPSPTFNPPAAAPVDTTPPAIEPTEPSTSQTPKSVPITTPADDSTATSSDNTDSLAPNLAEPAKEEENEVKSQIENFMTKQTAVSTPAAAPEEKNEDTDTPTSLDMGLTPEASPDSKEGAEANGYSPQPTGKKVIEPLPDEEDKPDLKELLEREKAKEIMEDATKKAEEPTPTMAAADTAPPPAQSVINPASQPTPEPAKDGVDPNSIAL